MTNEEEKLLLKDLAARVPYGVNVLASSAHITDPIRKKLNTNLLFGLQKSVLTIKPYLRPMSSMTEEEKKEVRKFGVSDDGAFHNDVYDVGIYMEEAFAAITWFLERHFDINYLIQKGLALEAPEGMYKAE